MATADQVKALVRSHAEGDDGQFYSVAMGRIAWKAVATAGAGLSHAEITLAAERAAKDAILTKAETVTSAALVAALRERRNETAR